MEIENLKAQMRGVDLNAYQRGLALDEYYKLLEYVNDIESKLENYSKQKNNCFAIFDEEDNIVQLYQTEEKANNGRKEFEKSHSHKYFYVDSIQIN